MQPGSSVATSLNEGESYPKHVAILKITGKKFDVEPIRLKTVRPFIMKEITLADEKALKGIWKKEENRLPITHHLHSIVEEMIRKGWDEYLENHDNIMPEEESSEEKAGRPLIRLRVEYSAPEGGRFDVENAQRFSSRFVGKTANATDVVQFYRKKKTNRSAKVDTVIPEEAVIAQLTLDSIKVDKLVKEFLSLQTLSILPQNSFGDAVSQFVDKDDKHAMEMFVNESLASQVKNLLSTEKAVEDDDILAEAMDKYRAKLEELFASGVIKRTKPTKLKPKPHHWDSDLDGPWEEQAGALVRSDDEDENEESNLGAIPPKPARGRGGGRGRGGRGAAAASTRKTAATKATTSRATRGKKQEVIEDDEESDVLMLDDDDEEDDDEDHLFVKATKATPKKAAATKSTALTRATSKTAPAKKPAAKQSTLNFSQATPQPAKANGAKKRAIEVSDDEISDDDAFEPVSTAKTKSRR
jgi:double-strand break repair protein MRE11